MASTSDAPPSYEAVTGKNRIPADRRRSMEDELRPLPTGWVRQYDPQSQHQFYVDTTKEPPRSIWHHPYDDEDFLATLPAEERTHLNRLHKSVSLKDIEAESSDDDTGHHHLGAKSTKGNRLSGSHNTAAAGSSSAAGPSTAAHVSDEQPKGAKKFGRRMKDKLTNTTHEQREAERQQRQREEEEAYRLHMAYRNALTKAMQTGEPQYLGKDNQGREIFIQPPNGPSSMNARYAPGGGGMIGYNPYTQGPYSQYGNARFIRPDYAYNRPYGYGYGGGLGMPIMGGLLGGALLGGLLF